MGTTGICTKRRSVEPGPPTTLGKIGDQQHCGGSQFVFGYIAVCPSRQPAALSESVFENDPGSLRGPFYFLGEALESAWRMHSGMRCRRSPWPRVRHGHASSRTSQRSADQQTCRHRFVYSCLRTIGLTETSEFIRSTDDARQHA